MFKQNSLRPGRPGTARLLPVFLLLMAAAVMATEMPPPTPESFFGFTPGADRKLLDYGQLVEYLLKLDDASPRLKMSREGQSPLGRDMYALFISSPSNIDNLARLREINRRLALEPDLPAEERDRLVAEGRVFVMVTLSMHSEEVAPSQMLPLFAYQVAAERDLALLGDLEKAVLLVVPCHNPDGMDMVVENYRKHLGTPYEGSDLPGLYHKYVGHDNNRDFVTLTQSDTRVVNRLFSRDWYPQVLVEKHQMGDTGPRFYAPPSHDPIAENIDEGLWQWQALFGTAMAKDMTLAGLKGVAQHWAFDMYWPGCTETSIWKNVISLLTENASCAVATPLWIEPTELEVHGKGLSEYKKGVNMPDPWPGGWWRLSDMVAYEQVSLRSLLHQAAMNREDLLRFRNELCRREVEKGRTQAPYAFILPARQRDRGELAALVNLLTEHGVRVYRLRAELRVGRQTFAAGDLIIPLAQPYRAFIKEVMERQRYPERHYTPGGEVIEPYDITSWSLPLQRDLEAVTLEIPALPPPDQLDPVDEPFVLDPPSPWPDPLWGFAFTPAENDHYRPVFKALQLGLAVQRLQSPAKIPGGVLPPGTFLIPAAGAPREKLAAVADAATTPPVGLAMAPEAVTEPLKPFRLALVESYFHHMEAGWTRYLFDQYAIPYTVVRPGDFEKTDFAKDFDLVLFPGSQKDLLLSGQYKSRGGQYWAPALPPEYTKGIGQKGMARLLELVAKGGIIIAWGDAVNLFLEPLEFKPGEPDSLKLRLPLRDVGEDLAKAGLDVPGSLLEVMLCQDHPLTRGLPSRIGVFSRGRPAFKTSVPQLDTDRRVIASFPEEHLLLSGWAEKEELLGRKAAMVWSRHGKGQFVFYAFNPLFRASTPATYKLLFNALLLPRLAGP